MHVKGACAFEHFNESTQCDVRQEPVGMKWISIAVGVLVAYAVVSSWPEIVRYRRMTAM